MSDETFRPDLISVICRAARAFMSGPAAKLIFIFRPKRLLNAVSSSERPLRPPKVCAPATKTSSSSFLAPVISDCMLSAAWRCDATIEVSASRGKLNRNGVFADITMPRSDYLKLTRDRSENFVLYRIANDPDGVFTALHRVDAFLVHTPEHNHAFVRLA